MILDCVDRLTTESSVTAQDRCQVCHINRCGSTGRLDEFLYRPARSGQQLFHFHQFGGLIDQCLIHDDRHIFPLNGFKSFRGDGGQLALRRIDQKDILLLPFDCVRCTCATATFKGN